LMDFSAQWKVVNPLLVKIQEQWTAQLQAQQETDEESVAVEGAVKKIKPKK
jgi:hypothetical protein